MPKPIIAATAVGRHARRLIALSAALSLCACATIAPNDVRLEAEHLSHLTQHRPFTDHPTDYGADLINAIAHWDVGRNGYVELGEGYNFSKAWPDIDSHGEIIGPREEFTARAGLRFRLK
jgi:hypothetical protein